MSDGAWAGKPKETALALLDPYTYIGEGRPPDDHGLMAPALDRLLRAAKLANIPIMWVLSESSGHWFELANWGERRVRAATLPSKATIVGGLTPGPGELVFDKHSYNAFAHSAFDLFLRCQGIRTVVLTGGSVMGPIVCQAKECTVRGYHVVAVSDGVFPFSGPSHDAGLAYIQENFGGVLTADEVIRSWGVPSIAT